MKNVFLGIVVLTVLAGAARALELGDKAPPVSAEVWLNGDPVNPAEPDGKTIYVVEFWATWCPPCRTSIPHLNELQEKFKDRSVVFIGVTDEAEEKVRPFAEKMAMKYRVAIDPARKIYGPYMKKVRGIPHAFVVDPQGVVVWSGHPLRGLKEALDGLLEGTYDLDKARHLEQLAAGLQQQLQEENFEGALDKADELIQAGGPKMEYYQMKMAILARMEKPERFGEIYRAMYEAFTNSADDLNTLAWIACTSPFEYADLALSWKAAQRAVELTERKNAAYLDTLARVHYALGLLEPAAAIQAEAVKQGRGPEETGKYQKTLDFYRRALEIRERVSAKAKGDEP